MQLKKAPFLLLAACLGLPALAAESVDIALTPLTRGAQLSKAVNLEVIWQAPYGATVPVESEPQSMTAEELVGVIKTMNSRMMKERPDLAPFVVCSFSNALIVRTVAQPGCSNLFN